MVTTGVSSSLKRYWCYRNHKRLIEELKIYLRPNKSRRFHAYCVGAPKSGTHSIAKLFSTYYYSLHEPEYDDLWDTLFALKDGLLGQEEFSNYIKIRDQYLSLELDSSNVNYFILDTLIKEFKDAKFILTIRDCYSWMSSNINQRISRSNSSKLCKQDEIRFGRCNFEYSQEESILKKYQLPSVDDYLAYWAKHNSKVLTVVPRNRLVVIKTHEISKNLNKLADFLDISPDTLNSDNSHAYKAKSNVNILSEIDQDFLKAKVSQHCHPLMEECFPQAICE